MRLPPLVALASFVLAASAHAQQGPRLSGAYDCQSPEGPAVLDFVSTRTLTYGGVQMAYRILGTAIQVIQDGLPVNYAFVQKGDRLDITTPDGDAIACVKAGGAQPQAKAPAGGAANALLRGLLCSYSGSSGGGSSYSSTRKAFFDGNGRFATGSESSFSAQYRDSGGNSTGAAGAYGAGDGPGGTYQVTGAQVGAPIRIRWDDGSDDLAHVHFVTGGRITEIKYGSAVYAMGVCE
jgi:hypothetical protein